jgi:starch synthase
VGLPAAPELPVVGMVGRLTEQKGVDLALEALGAPLEQGRVRAVILGQGEPRYVQLLQEMAGCYPDRLAVVLAFADDVARLIYGGCDMFLMPSRFEPCGLGQLIAMRYGCVPIVRRTGGLADTVRDHGAEGGTGFVFERVEGWATRDALERALAVYADRPAWVALQRRGMAQDFSWGPSARKYEALYYRALAAKGIGT